MPGLIFYCESIIKIKRICRWYTIVERIKEVSRWLQNKLPQSFLDKINPSPSDTQKASSAESNEWGNLLKSYAIRVVLYSVVLVSTVQQCGAVICTHTCPSP